MSCDVPVGGEGHESAGQSQALELQPLAVLDSELVTCFKQKLRFEDTGGLSGEKVPSAEVVSQWVLDRISEVSCCLVEALWRQETPSLGVSWSLLKIVSWNVRGLNDKRVAMKAVLRSAKPDIVCLQETKMEVVGVELIREVLEGRFVEWTFLPSLGTVGGVLL
ncbi:hypothetical protein CsSME_00023054 [Camellia sinensis var. sinensis]